MRSSPSDLGGAARVGGSGEPEPGSPWMSPFRFAAFHWGTLWCGFQILRLVLALAFSSRTQAAGWGDYGWCFLAGLARDAVVAGALTLPWVFWLLWVPHAS